MKNVATKVEGEKLLSLYHPFDTQMNEGMNNAVSRRCPKNKVFTESGGLKYRVASVAGQQTQGVTKYNKDVYKRCGMKMSQLQESFWKQKEKRRNDGAAYKAQFNRKRKRNEKIHAARFEAVKQERYDNKTGKTYSSGVALLEDQDQEATTKNANAQCKHCGRNDHQRKSSILFPFFQGKANHSTGTGITCASSVAGVSLQRPADQANQMDVSNSC